MATNASPIYLILFISATYFLNRSCVYCTLLLAILVIALFDFRQGLFEPRQGTSISNDSSSSSCNATAAGNGTVGGAGGTDGLGGLGNNRTAVTAELVASAVNSTAAAMASAAVEGIKRRIHPSEEQWSGAVATGVVKGFFARRTWRIPCVDVLVRL
ncbi:hypothetical protein H2201_003758 [Coniosporium apollinis]|uniref:Uncharacterized protein n=1 Tax=Coniosporium apollinis TaxID=61459 RepID=A0ABQ9NUL4_9PEZI|nr:hypothetical protein H2201_003758 [Coniosporium apollinis]